MFYRSLTIQSDALSLRFTDLDLRQNGMRWLTLILLVFLSACSRSDSRRLSGPPTLDSTAVMLKWNGSLKNVEAAKLVTVIERRYAELPTASRVPPDSCGAPALLITADVEIDDGRRFTYQGHGASPCDADAPIIETLDLRSVESERLPTESIRSIRLRSSKPVALKSIEWQTWRRGL